MSTRAPEPNKSKAKPEPDARPRSLRTPPPSGSRYLNIKVSLPEWYIKLIDDEAARMGYTRRASFLEFLVRVYAGNVVAQRAPTAPKVKTPTAKELEKEQVYLWHCPAETRRLLDEILLRSGGINPRAWITIAMNTWVGLPPLARLVP